MSKPDKPFDLQKPAEAADPDTLNLLLEAGFLFSVSFWLRKSKALFVSLFRRYIAGGKLYKLFGALKSIISAVLSKCFGRLLFNSVKSGWNAAVKEMKTISEREGLDFNPDDIKTVEELCAGPPEEAPPEAAVEPEPQKPEAEPEKEPAQPEPPPEKTPQQPEVHEPAEPPEERKEPAEPEPTEPPAEAEGGADEGKGEPAGPPEKETPEPSGKPSEPEGGADDGDAKPAEPQQPSPGAPAAEPTTGEPAEKPAMEIGDNRFDPRLPVKEPDAQTDSRTAADDFLPAEERPSGGGGRAWTDTDREISRNIRFALRRIDYFRETFTAQACFKAREILRMGINEGKNPLEIAEEIFQSVGGDLHRLRTVAITETTWAVNVGRMAAYQQTPFVKGLRFRCVHTETTTKWCEERDGLGLLWQEGLRYIRSQSPPVYFNCRSRWEPIITDDPDELKAIKAQRPLWDSLERPDDFDNQLYDKDTPARWLTPGGYTIER